MNKELEALKRIGNNLEHHYPENIKDFNILKQALQRLEAIDNANSSEAMKALDRNIVVIREKDYTIIEQALIKSQEQEKVLKILKEKNVEIYWLKHSKTVEEYNKHIKNLRDTSNLIEEEFDLLKRYLDESKTKN